MEIQIAPTIVLTIRSLIICNAASFVAGMALILAIHH